MKHYEDFGVQSRFQVKIVMAARTVDILVHDTAPDLLPYMYTSAISSMLAHGYMGKENVHLWVPQEPMTLPVVGDGL